MREKLAQLGWRIWERVHADERGLTTLEYIIGASVILVVLAAAVMAWNNGLATRINQLVQQLMGTP
jgi:Flp pilus assembly pilin Flp